MSIFDCLFGTQKDLICEECCDKTTAILVEEDVTAIQSVYRATYRNLSEVPLAMFSEPGCYLRIHTDRKVCCFVYELFSQSERVFERLRNVLGMVEIDNQSAYTATRTIPETDFHEIATLTVPPKTEKVFQVFNLWLYQ